MIRLRGCLGSVARYSAFLRALVSFLVRRLVARFEYTLMAREGFFVFTTFIYFP